jgi:hypothetical protein
MPGVSLKLLCEVADKERWREVAEVLVAELKIADYRRLKDGCL